jgi:hypothetical protein
MGSAVETRGSRMTTQTTSAEVADPIVGLTETQCRRHLGMTIERARELGVVLESITPDAPVLAAVPDDELVEFAAVGSGAYLQVESPFARFVIERPTSYDVFAELAAGRL